MGAIEGECDVLVIGSGNAGFCAAISARQSGASNVVIIDKCPEDWAGGNSYFTAGAFRAVHFGLPDILPLVNNVDSKTADKIDLVPYTNDDFTADLKRVTGGRSDEALGKVLVHESNETMKWLRELGVRFQLSFNRQAYEVNGRFKFWGGLCLKTQDGGKGLIEDHTSTAQRYGIHVQYSTVAKQILTDVETSAVNGVLVETEGKKKVIKSRAVIMAAGGFEANPRMRTQYLGPGWDLAYVRGTPFNTGDLLEIAIRDVGAKQAGNWSGCHSVSWDANAPHHSGDRQISNEFTKSGYPLGLMISVNGERFVDEGVDLRNYTYAKFGRAILLQPEGMAFQIWDGRTIGLLRDEEYREDIVQRIMADTVEELAEKCAKVGLQDPLAFLDTISNYNRAVQAHRSENPDIHFDPTVKDGLSTQSSSCKLVLPKSNWALPIDKPPFLAVKVACGVTFTFGGLAVDPETTGVLSGSTGKVIDGLFCVGEMMGGLFWGNYPGGSGLTSGSVFGRRAGRAAAKIAKRSMSAGSPVRSKI
jgi:precorrin 3B synthase CobZ